MAKKSIKSQREQALQTVCAYLNEIGMEEAAQYVDDEVFMMQAVFPFADIDFIDTYWRYKAADHYMRNKEFYRECEKREIELHHAI